MNRFAFDSADSQGWLYYQGHCIFSGPVEFARKLHRAVPVPSGATTIQVVLRRKHTDSPKKLNGGLPHLPGGLVEQLNRQPPYWTWSWGEVHVLDAGVLRHKVRIPKHYAHQFYEALRFHKLTGVLHLVNGYPPPAEPQTV